MPPLTPAQRSAAAKKAAAARKRKKAAALAATQRRRAARPARGSPTTISNLARAHNIPVITTKPIVAFIDRNGVKRPAIGDKRAVYEGRALKTASGLTRADLMLNKRGKVVSVKQHEAGLRAFGNISGAAPRRRAASPQLTAADFEDALEADPEMDAYIDELVEGALIAQMDAQNAATRARARTRSRERRRSSSPGPSRRTRASERRGRSITPRR